MNRSVGYECSTNTAQFSKLAAQSPAARAPDPDHRLVARAKRGDEQAFAELFQRHQHRLARLLYRVIGNPSDVEDLTQEVFIKAYRGLHAFRGESAFYSWLYRIGINTAKNHLATTKRRGPTMTGVDFEDAEGFEDAVQLHDLGNPLNMLRAGEIARTVECAAAELSPELRDALYLCENEAMSYEDIARCVGCPIGTVRSRIFRAREAIAERLRPMLDSEHERVW